MDNGFYGGFLSRVLGCFEGFGQWENNTNSNPRKNTRGGIFLEKKTKRKRYRKVRDENTMETEKKEKKMKGMKKEKKTKEQIRINMYS